MEAPAHDGPAPIPRRLGLGQFLPSFQFSSTIGTIRQVDFLGVKNLLFAFDHAGAARMRTTAAILSRLYDSFGDRAAILLVSRFLPNTSVSTRLCDIRQLRIAAGLPFPVAIDHDESPFHLLEALPGSIFLMDEEGRLVWEGAWSASEASIRDGLAKHLGPATPRYASGTFPRATGHR